MTTTKFQIRTINQFLLEIFGNQEVREPLLTKDLSQKVKYQLKKLGNSLQEEYKTAVTQLQELFAKYSEDIPAEEPKEGEEPKKQLEAPKKRVKEEFREQFQKEATEIEDMEVEISHYSFTERDFIDHSTGDVVGGQLYLNLLDLLLEKEWNKETA